MCVFLAAVVKATKSILAPVGEGGGSEVPNTALCAQPLYLNRHPFVSDDLTLMFAAFSPSTAPGTSQSGALFSSLSGLGERERISLLLLLLYRPREVKDMKIG